MALHRWLTAAILTAAAAPAFAEERAAIEGCMARVRRVGGPDAANGITVQRADVSQAGSIVTLRDAGGTVWRCVAASNGTVSELRIAQSADDGEGAMAGAVSEPGATGTRRVRLPAGTHGMTFTGSLAPGASTRYVLGARNGQFLDVHVEPAAAGIDYQIFNPDHTFLLEMTGAERNYRGQLWQSGDHAVEVINRSNGRVSYRLDIGVR